MKGYLVDTNILSELTKLAPAPQVEAFLQESKTQVFVSVLSVGEIDKGIAGLPLSKKRTALEVWLHTEMMPWFGDRVLPVTLTIAQTWGRLAAQLQLKGRPRPIVDALLAATAYTHDLVLVTRNVRDYDDMGVTVLNPWREA